MTPMDPVYRAYSLYFSSPHCKLLPVVGPNPIYQLAFLFGTSFNWENNNIYKQHPMHEALKDTDFGASAMAGVVEESCLIVAIEFEAWCCSVSSMSGQTLVV